MANTNTVAQVNGLSLGNVTTETAFASLNPIGGSSAGFGSGTTRAIVAVKPDVALGLFDGRPFRVRATCKAVSNGATNFTLKVYWNTGGNTNQTTFTNDVLLMTSGAVALASKAGSIFVSSLCIWDAASGSAGAASEATVANIATPITVPTANSGALTIAAAFPTQASITNTSGLQFFATALFGTTQTGNAVTLTELSIDQI